MHFCRPKRRNIGQKEKLLVIIIDILHNTDTIYSDGQWLLGSLFSFNLLRFVLSKYIIKINEAVLKTS